MKWRQRDCNRGDRYLKGWSNTCGRIQGYSRKHSTVTLHLLKVSSTCFGGLDWTNRPSYPLKATNGKNRLGFLYQKLANKHNGMLRSSSLPSLILKSSREIFGSREKRPTSVTRATITSKSTILSLMNLKSIGY